MSHEHLVDRVRHHDYSKPYSRMVSYLDDMDAALFMAVGPQERPATVLAALGPKMLRLSADKADGAHPYFVPVEHTAQAREILGPDPILAPEQMVVLDTDRGAALEIARKGMAIYLRAPNYVNNLKRLASPMTTWPTAAANVWSTPSSRPAMSPRSARVDEHFAAGASHVCVQVLSDNFTDIPEGAWRDLAAALS